MQVTELEIDDVTDGDILVRDGDLCLVSSTDTSSAGKHGTAKVTLELTNLADGTEDRINQPEDSTVEVLELPSERNPIIRVGDGDDHFDPVGARVAPGSNVVWMWNDDAAHELAADDGAFGSSRESGAGYTVEHTFQEAGAAVVRCREHDEICVIVVEQG